MYAAGVLLLGFLLPAASAWTEHHYVHGAAPLFDLVGKWLVFWATGVRLTIAGIRQQARPRLTSQGIFGMTSDDPLPFVRELGVANLAAGLVGLFVLWRPDFVLPAALSSAVFYFLAGVWHAAHKNRGFNRSVALYSDLLLGLLFAAYVGLTIAANAGFAIVIPR